MGNIVYCLTNNTLLGKSESRKRGFKYFVFCAWKEYSYR